MIHPPLRAAALVIALCALCGCGADDSAADFEDPPEVRPPDPRLARAATLLDQGELRGARAQYDAVATTSAGASVAAAGRAITSLLLLPESPAARALLAGPLMATRPRIDAGALLWDEGGILDWFARGASWDGSGAFIGVRDIVSDDLPWSEERSASLAAWAAPLTAPAGELVSELGPLVDELAAIERDLLEAESGLGTDFFYLPASLFHDPALALALNRADLAALRGLSAATRAAIHFARAYEHDWTLADALAPDRGCSALARVDALWLRALREKTELSLARDALADALSAWGRAAELGRSQRSCSETTLACWAQAGEEARLRAIEELALLRDALDGPVPLGEAGGRLSLAPLFEGRAVPPAIDWIEASDEEGCSVSVAARDVFLGEAFEPALSPRETARERLGFALATYAREVFGPWIDRLERAYGLELLDDEAP